MTYFSHPFDSDAYKKASKRADFPTFHSLAKTAMKTGDLRPIDEFTPHGLLTVVSAAAGALAAAPQHDLTAAAAAHCEYRRLSHLRVERGASSVRTAPEGQTHGTTHPHRPPHTPRAAYCGKRRSWRPRRRPAA